MTQSHTIQNQINDVIRRAAIHMMITDRGFSFAEDGESHANTLVLEDMPVFITELQEQGILPNNGTYLQYSIGATSSYEKRYGETEKRTQFIIFDKQDTVISTIPYREVLALQEQHIGLELRCGLKEKGLEYLVQALI